MTIRVDTLIVGGGQGGLSTSYYLKQQGRQHIVLEKSDQVAPAWRGRWDSFTLITPNWMTRLPGAVYQDDHPDGFLLRDDVVAYFEEYVAHFDLPLQYGYTVTSVEAIESGYLVRTDKEDFEATNVVMATGLFQQAKMPSFSADLSPEIRQLHSSEYRNPGELPAGAVLVVGSAQSGCQIAEELYQSGRKVYLSVGSAGRIPRRYRGQDITRWLGDVIFDGVTVDQLPSPKAKFGGSLQGTGKDGGHTINLHQFVKDGVVLLGHVQSIQGDRLLLVPDLMASLAHNDKFEADLVKRIDDYIEKNRLDYPEELLPDLRDGYAAEEIIDLDLKAAGIQTIIWATGYQFDFSLVKLPVFDEDGYPVQRRGVSEYPGLYFISLPFLYTWDSGILAGVGGDAAHITSLMATNGIS